MKDYEGKLMGNFCELSRKSFFLLFDVEKGMLKYLFFCNWFTLKTLN